MHSHRFKMDTKGFVWPLFIVFMMVVVGESAKTLWAEDNNCLDLINQIGAQEVAKLKMPTRTNENMYYRCVVGQKMPMTCPEDMVFSSRLNVCDDPPPLSKEKNPAQKDRDEEGEDRHDGDKEEDIDEKVNSGMKHKDKNEEKSNDETKRRHHVKEEEKEDEHEENEQPRRENEEENEEHPHAEENDDKEQLHRVNQEENEDTLERPHAEEKEPPHRVNEEEKYENNENYNKPRRTVNNEENEEVEEEARVTTVEAVELTRKPEVVTKPAPITTTVVDDVITTETITTTKKPNRVPLRKKPKTNRPHRRRPMKKMPAKSAYETNRDILVDNVTEQITKQDPVEIWRETSVKNGDSFASTKVSIDQAPPVSNSNSSVEVVKKPVVPDTKPAKPTVAKQKGNMRGADTTAKQQVDPRPVRPVLTSIVRDLLKGVIGEE